MKRPRRDGAFSGSSPVTGLLGAQAEGLMRLGALRFHLRLDAVDVITGGPGNDGEEYEESEKSSNASHDTLLMGNYTEIIAHF